MKWSMTLTEGAAQFNLEGETPHEEELCKILTKFHHGTVHVHQGVRVGLNQGGFIREWEDPKVCAITISKPVPVTLPGPIGDSPSG